MEGLYNNRWQIEGIAQGFWELHHTVSSASHGIGAFEKMQWNLVPASRLKLFLIAFRCPYVFCVGASNPSDYHRG